MAFRRSLVLGVTGPVVEKDMRANTWISRTVPKLKVRLYEPPFLGDDVLERAFDTALAPSFGLVLRADCPKTDVVLESPPRRWKCRVVDKAVCLKQHLVAFKSWR